MAEETHKQVQEYYGQKVKSTDQLLTNVCTVITGEGGSAKVKQAIKNVHPEVLSKWVTHITYVPWYCYTLYESLKYSNNFMQLAQ